MNELWCVRQIMRQIKPNSQIFLLEGPDQKSLLATITQLFSKKDLHILSAFNYVDCPRQRFFLRLEAEGNVDKDALLTACQQIIPKDYRICLPGNAPKKLAILGSVQPYSFGDIALRCLYKELHADIVAVMSNHLDLESLAQKFAKPFYYLPIDGQQDDHEDAIEQVLDNHQVDYVVLCKYDRILSHEFVVRYPHKIINVNHSFLPTVAQMTSYREAYERGIKLIGATTHFVTDDINNGPIITQKAMAIPHAANEEDIRRIGHNVEKSCLVEALQLISEDRLFVDDQRTIICE